MAESQKNLNTDELRLLARLEEANRLLEADEKSLKSLSVSNTSSHSRKGSISSVKSGNSAVSQFSNLTFEEDPAFDALQAVLAKYNCKIKRSPTQATSEDSWELWGRIVNDWETYSKKKPQYIRDLVRRGIPHHFRGLVWQLLCNAYTSQAKEQYADLLKRSSPYEKVIRRDIARTYPEHDFFKEKDGLGQESLFNVMKAYSLIDREVGYCQGSGFIVGLLLMQMPEEEAFAVLVTLMHDYKLRDLFKPHMVELGLCMFKLECMLQDYLPDLYMHFQGQGFHTSIYASSWFLTLFTTALPISVACRIMDIFISEGFEIIFRVAVAILCQNQVELLAQDMEGMLKCLQKEAPSKHELDPDALLQTAFQVKINTKKMKKLEKEYTIIKSKEQEDQVELRRLRTENRLLRQRVENLEKETATLADRLVSDQVTRAQEAEEMFAVRRELSTVKTQNENMTQGLEEANHVIRQLKQQSSSDPDNQGDRAKINRLQTELVTAKQREADTRSAVRDLKDKIQCLEDENDKLQREPVMTIVGLQEELIAVKLREAEANLSMKEMRKKISDLQLAYEVYMESISDKKGSRTNVQHLHDELMAVKLRDAEASAEFKDMKQKVMELETQNQICSHQIKRLDDENTHLKEKLDEATEREKKLRSEIKENERKLGDNESRWREEHMMSRIKDAEHSQTIAEMRRRIAELEIENQEFVTAGQLKSKGDNDLEETIAELQEEVLQLRMTSSLSRMSFSMNQLKIESDTEDEEDLNTTIRDNRMTTADLGLTDSWRQERSGTLTRLNNSLNNNNDKETMIKSGSNGSLSKILQDATFEDSLEVPVVKVPENQVPNGQTDTIQNVEMLHKQTDSVQNPEKLVNGTVKKDASDIIAACISNSDIISDLINFDAKEMPPDSDKVDAL